MCATKVAFPGFNAPAAGFEAPLEMLSACHGRVENQCQTLLRLVPHLAENGPVYLIRETQVFPVKAVSRQVSRSVPAAFIPSAPIRAAAPGPRSADPGSSDRQPRTAAMPTTVATSTAAAPPTASTVPGRDIRSIAAASLPDSALSVEGRLASPGPA